MQDKYVGDVGDFGKYLLLLNICLPDELYKKSLKLGVNWYRVEDDGKNDGKHIKYLLKDNFKLRNCCNSHSQKLYDKLERLLFGNVPYETKVKLKNTPYSKWNVEFGEELLKKINENRKVEKIKEVEILPKDTEFYGTSLSLENNRQQWVADGFKKLKECDVVFFDPDNGLKDENGNSKSIKHIYYSELEKYMQCHKNLIIYHHLKWDEAGLKQAKKIKRNLNNLNQKFNKNSNIVALWYHRGTARIFFIISNGEHKKIINERIDKFVANFDDKKSNKERHFSKI